MNSQSAEAKTATEPAKRPGIRFVKTGLLVAGSVLLGGLAVVLWNRNSLTKLHQPVPAPNQSIVEPDADEE
jgi:hypothetical protein